MLMLPFESIFSVSLSSSSTSSTGVAAVTNVLFSFTSSFLFLLLLLNLEVTDLILLLSIELYVFFLTGEPSTTLESNSSGVNLCGDELLIVLALPLALAFTLVLILDAACVFNPIPSISKSVDPCADASDSNGAADWVLFCKIFECNLSLGL
ncbi:hypothetical protein LELG_03390 [Lodderomyces elongisporus NRRL YB-4239]|uniref:Uncharacterized protein n=1 Tax=Lodderomyces elongisporus (strain ATCC 11503 / CBS 2605 / JCM 1781 / NBRC 1676 / NRRL YB-4239) TaxID=379508 RepID=A5E1A3_LODEL|nr:hypothetical protein LELG_03390 [Lodderomyces elongisporus NRRL YB-4239]